MYAHTHPPNSPILQKKKKLFIPLPSFPPLSRLSLPSTVTFNMVSTASPLELSNAYQPSPLSPPPPHATPSTPTSTPTSTVSSLSSALWSSSSVVSPLCRSRRLTLSPRRSILPLPWPNCAQDSSGPCCNSNPRDSYLYSPPRESTLPTPLPSLFLHLRRPSTAEACSPAATATFSRLRNALRRDIRSRWRSSN